MLVAVFLLILATAAILAGGGHVQKAHIMRSFRRTRGRILTREVVASPTGQRREGHFGDGGGSVPKVTYRYEVDGKEYVGDRITYASRGLKREAAARALAAIPDEVDVWCDPARPADAYLERHGTAAGWALVGGGGLTAIVTLMWLIGQRT